MTDKQEVIREIWDELKNSAEYGYSYVSKGIAEDLYDRMAPLIRGEFPEAVLGILQDVKDGTMTQYQGALKIKHLWWEGQTTTEGAGNTRTGVAGEEHPLMFREFPEERLWDLIADKDLWTEKGLFQQIKILFEEEDHIAEAGQKSVTNPRAPARREQESPSAGSGYSYITADDDNPKGTCQTCGGRRRVSTSPFPSGGETDWCPDCKGTGEQQDRQCLKCGGSTNKFYPTLEQMDCKHRFGDERSGDKRRENIRTAAIITRVRYNDRRILEDRRKYEIKVKFVYDKPQGVCEGIYTDNEGHLKKTRRISKERRVYENANSCEYCTFLSSDYCKRHAPITEPKEPSPQTAHLNVLIPLWPKVASFGIFHHICGDFVDRRTKPDRRKAG